ncbi:MSHA biogenesis protein MshP [Marinobacter sp. es.048]|uniref:hypothetical protein n=1 Tax=Marinobacter sp. es.048 TaxID=1761795 RepID=UPI000B5981F6|nr:hypothetical protein [Marinobacter sp. es.048]SNC76718.1 MSHA biogenesis protein MshP [Marinobacter sp. es.048]
MSPNDCLRNQKGAGLPVALFVITVLALLVFGMAQLQQSSGEAVSLQIQSQRAFFAAESGAQVRIPSIFEAIDDGNTSFCPSSVTTFNGSGLADCSATFDCAFDSASGVFTLASNGSCGNGKDAATRTVEVRLQ